MSFIYLSFFFLCFFLFFNSVSFISSDRRFTSAKYLMQVPSCFKESRVQKLRIVVFKTTVLWQVLILFIIDFKYLN